MSPSDPSPSTGPRPLRVLFVEDSPEDVELCLHQLRQAGFEVEYDRVQTPFELAQRLGEGRYDLVLSDYRLPQWTGLDAFHALQKMGVELPLVLVTGTLGDELAVECLKKGIRDYVLKEKLARLPFAVERALREKALEDEQRRAAEERERLLRQTQERMKELTCIYQVTRAVQRGATMGEIVREVANLIPAALHFPEAAQVRVRFEDEEATSPGFREGPWRMSARLLVKGVERGRVEVFYPDATGEKSGGSFLQEERELIEGIARSLSEAAEHLAAEQALRASESQYRKLFESANDAILIFEPENEVILEANPEACRVYGLPREELVGKSLKEFTRDVPRGEQQIRELLQQGSCSNFETVHLRRDGTPIFMLTNSIVIEYQGRKAVLSANRDVTRRKQAEEALRESEQRLKTIFDTAADGILVADVHSQRFQSCNPRICQMTGYSAEELLTLAVPDLHPENDLPQVLDHFGRQSRRETELSRDLAVRRKDGSVFYADVNAVPMVFGGRELLVGFFRDITERRQAEEALRRAHDELELRVEERTAALAQANQELRSSEARYRLLMEQAADAILLLAPGGRFTGASSRACELLGYSREELLQMSILNLVQPDPERAHQVEERLAAGELVLMEEEFRSKSGEWIPVEINVRRISDREEQLIARDIRERRRAQEAREQLAAVLQATSDFVATSELAGTLLYMNPAGRRLVGLGEQDDLSLRTLAEFLAPATREIIFREALLGGTWTGEAALLAPSGQEIPVLMVASVHQRPCAGMQFMSVVAHDITQRKQLENVKDELVSMVSHELRTPLASLRGFAELMLTRDYAEDKRREFLSIIHNESKRLAELINNFLDLQRIQSGKQVYDFVALDTAELLREAIRLFQPASPQHRLELTLESPLPWARGDRDRVRQVVANLVANAIKYSPEGGRVVLGARREEGAVSLWVSDEGIGIPTELLPHLFTKFYRVDNAVNRGIAGTGLGLALVRQIVENHGGRVWAESTPGRGSTFYFTLPLAEEARQAA